MCSYRSDREVGERDMRSSRRSYGHRRELVSRPSRPIVPQEMLKRCTQLVRGSPGVHPTGLALSSSATSGVLIVFFLRMRTRASYPPQSRA